MPWPGLLLYLVLFFLVMHLVDRLASRSPESDQARPEDGGCP